MLTDQQIRDFAETGWLVLANLIDAQTLAAVDGEVDRLVAGSPPPLGHVGPHFYWRDPSESAVLFSPLGGDDGVLARAGELVGERGIELAFNQAQVALNIPPYSHRPGRPHIDGYALDQKTPGTFTLLAALLLTDQSADNSGNLWVWPGTHRSHAVYFATHGPDSFASAGGYPDVDLPEPTQVHGKRGDVLLAHYLLGHNIGGNYASSLTRRAIYWRLRAPGHESRWRSCLVDPWHEFSNIRILPDAR